ncbi:MAG: choice-of-anchor tandem repeat GloVer-containing protein [Bryobacteraceae bacterium]|jgi:uncharacterized repeat protein (TIGR03803 family)
MSKIHLAIACALGVTGMAVAQAQTASEIVLQSFTTALVNGGDPYSGVIRDAAGNLYGTTYFGGTATAGVVYKLDTAGRQTVLHNFTGGADGANPYAGVVDDSAGNLYGTTSNGGAAKAGVVYKLDTAGHETVLYTFTGGADGGWPYAGMIRDPAGNFYGAGSGGGTAGWGVLFKLDATGQETVLYNFTGGADGAVPYGTPTRDPAGNLYGTTTGGGTAEAGVVYKLDTAGNYTVLYTFTGGADGGLPYPGVMRDSAGNLYGTTSRGGSFSAGVVYELNTGGQETVLYNFAGGNGMAPSGVIRDPAGNLYGTGPANAGVVYKLDTAGNYTAMYSFMGKADGGRPYGGVIFDSAGNLYGTTFGGGTGGVGVVYKLDAAGQETVLFGFPGATGGSCPHAGVIRDPEGNLYGTTERGGAGDGGVVYKLDTTGQETVLYTFTDSHGSQGTGVIRDPAGNLYGTTYYGGTERTGSVYKLDTAGNYTVLYSFTDGADGGYPSAGVILDPAGNLYGTTPVAGTGGWGVVYKLDTSGQETVLYSFTGGADGSGPSGVVRDAEGNLYGTTWQGGAAKAGVVFRVDPAGNEAVLYTFTGHADGAFPLGGVIRDSAGNLYGTTSGGGTAAHAGVVYKLDAAGNYTVLYSFTGGDDGDSPQSGVTRDSAGNLYGTTYRGGAAGAGVVYKLDTAGNETVLHSFTGGADGSTPYAGVILDSAGNLYGTTFYGGKYSGGVVFKLTPQ